MSASGRSDRRQYARVSDDHERCLACGFDGATYDDTSLTAAIEGLGEDWRELFRKAGRELRVRPKPRTWSAIEYAAHSRDITALHVFAVEQALTGTEPVFPAIEGDALIEASAASYGDEDPDAVVGQLDREGHLLARLAADAGADAWGAGSRLVTTGAPSTDFSNTRCMTRCIISTTLSAACGGFSHKKPPRPHLQIGSSLTRDSVAPDWSTEIGSARLGQAGTKPPLSVIGAGAHHRRSALVA